MGNLNGEEADKLDERLWGDDEEEDEEDEEDGGKAEETGPGMDEVSKNPHPRVQAPAEELVLPHALLSAAFPFLCFSSLSSISSASLAHTESLQQPDLSPPVWCGVVEEGTLKTPMLSQFSPCS